MNMNNRTNKTYIVFINLPNDISSFIEGIIKEVSPKSTQKLKPHITIKYDEDLLAEESKIVDVVGKFVSNLSSFKVRLGKMQINESNLGFNVYIQVQPRKKIVNIVHNISKLIEPFIDPNSPEAFKSTKWEQSDKFYPHISIKGTSDRISAKKILNKANEYHKNYKNEFTLKSITLARWNKDRWKKVESFKLKADKKPSDIG